MQPWRCATCGDAVRKGYNDPCKCTQVTTPAKKPETLSEKKHVDCDSMCCRPWTT